MAKGLEVTRGLLFTYLKSVPVKVKRFRALLMERFALGMPPIPSKVIALSKPVTPDSILPLAISLKIYLDLVFTYSLTISVLGVGESDASYSALSEGLYEISGEVVS